MYSRIREYCITFKEQIVFHNFNCFVSLFFPVRKYKNRQKVLIATDWERQFLRTVVYIAVVFFFRGKGQ